MERDLVVGHRQANQLVNNWLAKRKCRQQMNDPYHFSGHQEIATFQASTNAFVYQPPQRKEIY